MIYIKSVRNVLAILVSIVYFIILFIMSILLFVANVFSPNYYTNLLNDINIKEIKLSDLGIDQFSSELGSDATVEDALVSSLEEIGLSKEDATKIVNDEKINEVVGTFMSDTVTYLTDNKEVPQLDVNDVKEILHDPKITSALGSVPSDSEIESFVAEFNKNISESIKEVTYNE